MQQHVVEHGEHDKALKKSSSSTVSGLRSKCLDTVLPLDPARSRRESKVDSVRLSLTKIQFTAHVILIIYTQLVSKLSGLPKGINDRLMTLRLPLSGKRHATIVSAYALTMANPDEVKDKFYDYLDSVISATPRTDKLILLGDFNSRVGTDHQTWEGVIETEGVGKCNSNGLLLLKKCAEHELNCWSLTQSFVCQLATRRHGCILAPNWHLFAYVIVRRKDRQDVRVTKTMCGADCWTNHRLVVSKLNLRIQPARRP